MLHGQAIDSSVAAMVTARGTLGCVIYCRKREAVQPGRAMRVRQAVVKVVAKHIAQRRVRLRAIFSKGGVAKEVPVRATQWASGSALNYESEAWEE